MHHPLIKSVYENYQDSVYTRIFARLYETHLILEKILNEIDNIDICEPSFIDYTPINAKGKVAIEAPRGSLIHSIKICDEKIKEYNIIVPTQFNLSSSTKEKPSPAQATLIKEDIKWSDFIFKCFDVCAVCNIH
ncbi:MAG: nickel-dependent hydrogenase large subunit [Nautiliaceae bacterium]